jgi:hypothetical protein
MKFLYFPIFLLLLFSCRNNEETRGEKPYYDSVNVVSYAVFETQFFQELQLPLQIDTGFIQKVDSLDRIYFQQVRSMKANFLFSEFPSSAEYDINTFCMIDSLKHVRKYQDYLDKLDIGMTKSCIAYKLGYTSLKDNLKLLLWGITQGSYEACPFFGGTTIIGTFVNSNNESRHLVLGRLFSAGDPPSMGSVEITSIITKKKISIKGKSISDDLDVPGEETTLLSVIVDLSVEPKFTNPFKKVQNTEVITEQ